MEGEIFSKLSQLDYNIVNVSKEINLMINQIYFVIKQENVSKSARKRAPHRDAPNLSKIIFTIV